MSKTNQALEIAFNYNVQKSNSLAMSSIFDFSEVEMDVANYLTVLVKPPVEDYENKEKRYDLVYDIDFSTLCHLTGTMRNGKTYKSYAKALNSLREKSVMVRLEDGRITPLFWIKDWIYDKNTGVAKVEISEKMIPLIIDLKTKYLTYKPEFSFLMRGKYSKRLYEELKAFCNGYKGKSKEIIYQTNLDGLKQRLSLENKSTYDNFAHFSEKVLNRAIEEINERTDIIVRYEGIKEGRRVVDIRFIIIYKSKEELAKVEEENKRLIERTEVKYDSLIPKIELEDFK